MTSVTHSLETPPRRQLRSPATPRLSTDAARCRRKFLRFFPGGFRRQDLRDLKPRDQIDIQSFLWVQGSDEYEE